MGHHEEVMHQMGEEIMAHPEVVMHQTEEETMDHQEEAMEVHTEVAQMRVEWQVEQ